MNTDSHMIFEAFMSRQRQAKSAHVIQEQTPHDLGKGFESNDNLNRLMADFGIDQKNKTKIIEFLMSLSGKGQAAKSAMPVQNFISAMKPAAQVPVATMAPIK